MSLKFMGKKRGMIQLFDEKGNVIVGTVIEAEPNIVTQVKTKQTDGYNAIQTGFDEVKTKNAQTVEKRVSKPLLGHFRKAGVAPCRHLMESRVDDVESYAAGQALTVSAFDLGEFVDVVAMSKGKGYQGVMKLHNFAGGPASHGSGFHRHAGSTGMRSTPGRSLPGGKKASHMGFDRVTVQNLEVVRVVEGENLIVVKGAVPGPRNGFVYLTKAVKKKTKAVKKAAKAA